MNVTTSLFRGIASKALLLLGGVAFMISFFSVTIPNRIGSNGVEVVEWIDSREMHFRLATGPIAQIIGYITMEEHPDLVGDGDAEERIGYIKNFLLSIPVAFGWFAIIGSMIILAYTWTYCTKYPHVLGPMFQIAGYFTLLAFLLLCCKFYTNASVFGGFHLGLGAYFIIASYLSTGIGLLLISKKDLDGGD